MTSDISSSYRGLFSLHLILLLFHELLSLESLVGFFFSAQDQMFYQNSNFWSKATAYFSTTHLCPWFSLVSSFHSPLLIFLPLLARAPYTSPVQGPIVQSQVFNSTESRTWQILLVWLWLYFEIANISHWMLNLFFLKCTLFE